MGRDLLRSHSKAMTKLRPEHRVSSRLAHPCCATGMALAAAASRTCSSLRLSSFGKEFCSPSALAWLQLGGRGATLAAGPSIALAGRAAACSDARLRSRRFPLETRKSIYQWRLETSESEEVKLALNEPIKTGEGETRLEAGKASPGLRGPCPPHATCGTGCIKDSLSEGAKVLAAEVGAVSGQGVQGGLVRPAELAACRSVPRGSCGVSRQLTAGAWLGTGHPEQWHQCWWHAGSPGPRPRGGGSPSCSTSPARGSCLGYRAALRLAQHPLRSKQSMQVWEKMSGLQGWLVAQPPSPCC